MKKYKFQIILIIIIFLYENSYQYWLNIIGGWAYLITLVYIISFLCTVGIAIYNIVKIIQARLKDKFRNILTISMLVVLILPFIFPGGLVAKRFLYKGIVLTAHMDGVAGNNGWLTLYGNQTYEYNYAFAIHIKGKYKVRNDTIFFDSPKNKNTYEFDYATLYRDKSNLTFGKDSIEYSWLKVFKNELIK